MDAITAYAIELGINTLLRLPRIYVGGYPKETYDDLAPQLLRKLPQLERLRSKLTPDQLHEVVQRERVVFDALTQERKKKLKVGTFLGDTDFAMPNQPHPMTDFRINSFLPLSFAAPNANWEGPGYGAGRFFRPDEKFTSADLAILPTSSTDLAAHDHDIRYALITSIPDEAQRAKLKESADAIFHLQIYNAEDLDPKLPNEIGDWYYKFVNDVLPKALAIIDIAYLSATHYAFAEEQLGNILKTVSRSAVRSLVPYYTQQGATNIHSTFSLDEPLSNSYLSMVTRHGIGAHIQVSQQHELTNFYLNSLSTPGRSEYDFIFRNQGVRDALALPDIERSLLRIADLREAPGIPLPQANRLIQAEVRNIERLMGPTFPEAVAISDAALLNQPMVGGVPTPVAEQWLDTVNTRVATHEPRARDIITRTEVAKRLLKDVDFWKSIAVTVALDVTINWIAKRGLSEEALSNPEFRKNVSETQTPYYRSHPFFSRLTEFASRSGLIGSLGHVEYTLPEVTELINAILFPVKDDPTVLAVENYFSGKPLSDEADEITPAVAASETEIQNGVSSAGISLPTPPVSAMGVPSIASIMPVNPFNEIVINRPNIKVTKGKVTELLGLLAKLSNAAVGVG